MNANLQQPTPTSIKDWLKAATGKIANCGIKTARLDCELILAHQLGVDRTFLHAHSDDKLGNRIINGADKNLGLRLNRFPLAYILKCKEFYGRVFKVSEDTLIPRPETEEIIESLKRLFDNGLLAQPNNIRLVDIGSGCGVIGITTKLEFPELEVTLTDISSEALEVARENAKNLSAKVKIIQSDLLADYDEHPTVILANLPYVNPEWERSPETKYEPTLALFADNNGRAVIERLIVEAEQKIIPNGFLIIESDPSQHSKLIEFGELHGFNMVSQSDYIVTLQKTN